MTQPGLASKLGPGYSRGPITTVCIHPVRSPVTALFISVERTQPGAGTARSYTISYDGGSLTVP